MYHDPLPILLPNWAVSVVGNILNIHENSNNTDIEIAVVEREPRFLNHLDLVKSFKTHIKTIFMWCNAHIKSIKLTSEGG